MTTVVDFFTKPLVKATALAGAITLLAFAFVPQLTAMTPETLLGLPAKFVLVAGGMFLGLATIFGWLSSISFVPPAERERRERLKRVSDRMARLNADETLLVSQMVSARGEILTIEVPTSGRGYMAAANLMRDGVVRDVFAGASMRLINAPTVHLTLTNEAAEVERRKRS